MNRPGVAAALLAVAATGSVLLVARQLAEPAPAASAVQVCQAVADLQDALDLTSLGDQAVLRARASRLADVLEGPPPTVGTEISREVAQDIVTVLDYQRSTVADLSQAIAPIARQCAG